MSEKSFRFTIEPWSVTKENKEYQTPIFNLFKRNMRLEIVDEEMSRDFYVLDAPEWINVIPLTQNEEVILVEQFRYGIEEPTLEIPGGMVDEGEDSIEAAKRELIEETGYATEHWQSLGKVSANPAIMNNFAHLYLAVDCQFKGEIESAEADERINVHLLPLDNFLDLIADGTIHHSIVLAAVARYLLDGRRET